MSSSQATTSTVHILLRWRNIIAMPILILGLLIYAVFVVVIMIPSLILSGFGSICINTALKISKDPELERVTNKIISGV